MLIQNLIELLEARIENPSQGLPEELFLFISRLTPMVNVDLLVKNMEKETLLTWRDDEFYGPGWHVPGGIVRFKEPLTSRIHAVAASELGASVEFRSEPLAVNEIMNAKRDTRGHFISLLYECRLTSQLDPDLEYKSGAIKNGEWAWHASCPKNLISVQEIYRPNIEGLTQT
ncbi:MAG: NUDIX hydrolase [Gammaproteobacteria bacterium]|nr:NUDIX hydrolase [Gammaproteobacteria bacterium]MBU1978071.1 NUDIX hydrolase [Gammaproteobacteria bacterium]